MTATMIKIEASPKMEAAIARCKKNHPKVRRISADTVQVVSSNDTYTVKFATPREGLHLAECNCKARTLCYHIVAALSAPAGVVRHSNSGILLKRERGGAQIGGWWV
jgi:hypothetical protein